MSESLRICEIFKSIQGESTRVGIPCSFVRLTGCNLRCSYCDTRYAREEGSFIGIPAIMERVAHHRCDLVEITGGEPLLQKGTASLVGELLANKKTVLVETNGSLDIGALPDGAVRIVDVKCPSSGMSHSFNKCNIERLQDHDEVKFVLGSRDDFEWALEFTSRHALHTRCPVLFSPVAGKMVPADLAQWIIERDAPVRLQLQLHRIIWGDQRGV